MARCTPSNLAHETMRWRQMDNYQLRRRLQKMSVPSKLACFLNVACAREEWDLAMAGVSRCNELDLLAVETSPRVFSVVSTNLFPNHAQEVPSFLVEQAIRSPSPSPSLVDDPPRPKSSTSKFIEETLAAADKAEEKEPKKKKSLYSRKLRVRRRK